MDAHWQVQEAKQKFSELLRKVHSDGPQFVTKHGEEVAVVIDIEEYRHLRGEKKSFVDHLLATPHVGELEIDRSKDLFRDIDFSDMR